MAETRKEKGLEVSPSFSCIALGEREDSNDAREGNKREPVEKKATRKRKNKAIQGSKQRDVPSWGRN